MICYGAYRLIMCIGRMNRIFPRGFEWMYAGAGEART